MKRRFLTGAAFVMTTAVLAIVSSAAATVAPPTLTDETFVDETPEIMATCNPDGTSTVAFSASGTAVGPYPGAFTETGTATIGPQTVAPEGGASQGTLLTFDAVFTIDSEVGQVVGTKRIFKPVTDPSFEVAVGQCNTFFGTELVDVIDRFTVRYDAQINTGSDEFTDRGRVPLVAVQRVRGVDVVPPVTFFQIFFENFVSDLAATEPLTTPGKATGGGQIAGGVTFGLAAKSDQNGVTGNCTVIDQQANTKLKCLDATTYSQTATHASFSGDATVNGVATTYRIDVDDNAEPGAGTDMFTITTTSGYSATGVLTQGNIQVHD